jgi:hypothetical protein
MKGGQSRGGSVPQQGRLLIPVQLDKTRGKGGNVVVGEAAVAVVESKE